MNELVATLCIFSDKSSLNELTYVYMTAKSVIFEKIGSFLSHGIISIRQEGNDEHVITMQSNLRSLMTRNGIDKSKLSIFLGINSYSNLDLLGPFELDNEMESDLKKCYNHLQLESNPFKTFFVDRKKPSRSIFLEPSPCLNMTKYPTCKKYCKWQHYAVRNDFARNLNRYFAINCSNTIEKLLVFCFAKVFLVRSKNED